ncbi:MAG: uroporphyrinogen decarboxylase family protein [Nitrososphaeria archaeon]
MNSRERVLSSLQHREPDKVPVDLGGMRSTGIMGIAYNRLKKHLGLVEGETRIYDIAQQLAEPEEKILKFFEVDCVDAARTLPPAGPSKITWVPWRLPDGSDAMVPTAFSAAATVITVSPATKYEGKVNLVPDGKGGWLLKEDNLVRLAMPKGSLYFDDVYHPLEKAEGKREVDAFFEGSYDPKVGFPPMMSKKDAESLRLKAKYLHDNTKYAILAGFGGNFFETGQYLRGFKNYLIDLIRHKELVTHINEKLLEYYRKNLALWLSSVGGYVHVGVFGDDLGSQDGPLISPKLYREMIQPYEKELFQYVKRNSNLYVFYHSCGSIYQLIPDIIDAGVDIINPVQISAKDMQPLRLKKEFGEELTFWGGGVETQRILGFGTVEDVRENVKKNIEVLAPGGGFVFATVHNIMANVPPENIVAVFEAVKRYGGYR